MNATSTTTGTRVRAGAAALLALPLLAACGPNFNPQTNQVYTPADGENSRSGDVDVLNTLIVSETPGTGRLIGGLANNNVEEDDTLTGVRGEGEGEGISYSLEGGDTTIPAGGLLQLADAESANIVASGDPEMLKPGSFVRLTFTFQNADEATLNIPVLPPGEIYADVELPSEAPSEPTESPTEATE